MSYECRRIRSGWSAALPYTCARQSHDTAGELEERGGGVHVLDDDADIVHPSDRHAVLSSMLVAERPTRNVSPNGALGTDGAPGR
jgi:hypothetical protein